MEAFYVDARPEGGQPKKTMTEQGFEPLDMETLRKYIYQLKGIMHVQVIPDEQGNVTEVHVIADRSRSAKQLARDIQSVALARFNIRIDHKVISIAQIDAEEDSPAHFYARLTPEGFTLSLSADRAQATVTLAHQELSFEGSAQGLPGVRDRNGIIVRATLEAVHQYLGKENIFSLAEVKNIPVADSTAVLVCLAVHAPREQDLLIGTAFVRDDPQMAAIKATLNAINRRLPLFLDH